MRILKGIAIVSGAIGLIALVLGAAVAWGPSNCPLQFPNIIGCALGAYEGLSGGLIATAGALLAAWLAWQAVQRQIEVTTEAVEKQRRDAGIRRLIEITAPIQRLLRLHHALISAKEEEWDRTYKELQLATNDPILVTALSDPILGRDQDILSLLINHVNVAAGAWLQKAEDVASYENYFVWALYIDLTNVISKRTKAIQDGLRIDELYDMRLVDPKKYFDARKNRDIPMPT